MCVTKLPWPLLFEYLLEYMAYPLLRTDNCCYKNSIIHVYQHTLSIATMTQENNNVHSLLQSNRPNVAKTECRAVMGKAVMFNEQGS